MNVRDVLTQWGFAFLLAPRVEETRHIRHLFRNYQGATEAAERISGRIVEAKQGERPEQERLRQESSRQVSSMEAFVRDMSQDRR